MGFGFQKKAPKVLMIMSLSTSEVVEKSSINIVSIFDFFFQSWHFARIHFLKQYRTKVVQLRAIFLLISNQGAGPLDFGAQKVTKYSKDVS